MKPNILQKSPEICRKLLSGYQFSASDRYGSNKELYAILDDNFEQFQHYLAFVGFSLIRDEGIILLEKNDVALNKEEKQTIVVLFLLGDLWQEKGKAFKDLFNLSIPLKDIDWFRDGYGKEYLAQVGIEENDDTQIESLFKRLDSKGVATYRADTMTVTLRDPADRLYNMARKIYQQIKLTEVDNEPSFE